MSAAIDIAKRYSKASVQRLAAMHDALRSIDNDGIAGDVVECGVWKGGHIILARLVSPQRHCWLFDTFTGMTPPGPHDRALHFGRDDLDMLASKQKFAVSVDAVRDCLRAEGVLDESRLTFVAGDVCETLRQDNLPAHIALLRLDTDWYDSTKVELEVLWPRLVKGGVIIIDDYGHWMGARKATQEYFGHHVPGYATRLSQIDYTAVMMVK